MKKTSLILMAIMMALSLFSIEAHAVRSGGTLNFVAPYGGDLFGLDPARSNRYQDFLVTMNIHRSLYRWDARENIPVVDLAESVEMSQDGLVYTFKLRSNIKFHNGRQMTADDIIWNYHRIASLQPASRAYDKIAVTPNERKKVVLYF